MNKRVKCPIEGCNFQFQHGVVGWDKHIGCAANHKQYHPDVTDHNMRLLKFKEEHPEFFKAALSGRTKSGTQFKVVKARKSSVPPRASTFPPVSRVLEINSSDYDEIRVTRNSDAPCILHEIRNVG